MKCENIKEQLVNYLKSELSNSERKIIDDHLSECEHCRLVLNNLETIWTDLGNISDKEPSSHFREHFHNMLNNEISMRETHTHGKSGKKGLMDIFQTVWPTRPQWALSYTFVFVVLGFGLGRWFLIGGTVDISETGKPQITHIQEEVSELRDMMAYTLLSQDSVQARLRGIDYARANGSSDPRVLTLLLNTFERDETSNVRLAALDAIKPHLDNPMVKERIYNRLLMETSPIVQLKIVNNLLDAAGEGWQDQLDELLKTGILDSTVTGFLQEAKTGENKNEEQEGVREL